MIEKVLLPRVPFVGKKRKDLLNAFTDVAGRSTVARADAGIGTEMVGSSSVGRAVFCITHHVYNLKVSINA